MAKILAIDDIDDNLISLKAILHDAFPGSTVLTAPNGPEGIQLAIDTNPDVILLDIFMPGMNGFEVCHQLKQDERVREIPVVFVTALKGDKGSRIKALEAGAEGFLLKPIDEPELIAMIRAMVKIKAANIQRRDEQDRLKKLVEERTRDLQKELEEKNRAEAELRQIEESFKLIFEWTNVAQSITIPSGIVNVNQAFCDMFGYTKEELKGKRWQELTFSEEVEIDEKLIDKILRGEQNETRRIKRYVHKNGSILWGDVSYALIRDENGNPLHFITTIIDITERKKGEETLRDSEKVFRALFNASPDSILLIDPHDPENSWPLVDCNEAACRLNGYTREEMLGQSIDFLNTYKGTPKDRSNYLDKLRKEKVIHTESFHRRKDGYVFPIEVTTSIITIGGRELILGIDRDITARKQAESEIREKEVQYRNLADSGSALIWTAGTDQRCNYFNQTWLKFTGRTLEQEMGNGWTQGVHPDDLDRCLQTFRSAFELRTSFEMEYRLRHVSGEYRWLQDSGTPNFNQEGDFIGYIGHCFDITDHKKMEGELISAKEKTEKSEKQFRLLFENLSSGFALHELIYDEKGKAVDYRFVAINAAYERLTHVKAINLIGKRVLKYSPQLDKSWIDKFAGVARTGHAIQFEHYISNLDKYFDYYAFSPLPDHFAVIFSDITDRKRMEKELIIAKERAERSEEKLKTRNLELVDRNKFIQTVLDHLPIGIALNTIDEGTATYMNKKFEEIYGWPSSEIISLQSFFENVYPDATYRNQIMQQILEDIQSGDPERMHWESIFVTRKDGAQRVINAVNIPLIDQNMMVSTVSDITDLHRSKTDLLAAKEKAEESDRLKSAFLANMSHEIRTPLNSIIGFSELVTDPDYSSEQQTEFARIIHSSGNNLLAIISDIMDLSKIEAGQIQMNKSRIIVNQLIREIHQQSSLKASEKGIELRIDPNCPTMEIFLESDQNRIKQVLVNFIGNAIKFTEQGFIEIGFKLLEGFVQFHVIDTGIGIPKDFHENIFERFRQVDSSFTRKYGGNGLGLSISKSLVEMLGGRIWIESEHGKGSAFYFTVPTKSPESMN